MAPKSARVEFLKKGEDTKPQARRAGEEVTLSKIEQLHRQARLHRPSSEIVGGRYDEHIRTDRDAAIHAARQPAIEESLDGPQLNGTVDGGAAWLVLEVVSSSQVTETDAEGVDPLR